MEETIIWMTEIQLRLWSYGMVTNMQFGREVLEVLEGAGTSLILYPANGGSRFLQNTGTYLPSYKASHARRM
jgi:hypothetical protein